MSDEDDQPRHEVHGLILGQPLLLHERAHVRKMPVHGLALHHGPFRNCLDRGSCWSDRAAQFASGGHNATLGFVVR